MNKPSRKRFSLAIAGAGVILAGGIAAWWWIADDKEPAAAPAAGSAPAASAKAPARMGPGLWTAEAASANGLSTAGLQPPQVPNITADGKLIVDRTLHQAIDFFLLGGLPGDRASHVALLRKYLRRTLPPSAGADAAQIVDRYVLYMNLHDDLLARQSLPQWVDLPTPAEAERITNWVVQRTRLRQTILGADVAKAWYADEEAAIQSGLAEFDAQNSVTAAVQSDGSSQSSGEAVSGRVSRMHEASREARREQFLRSLTEDASKSYIALERERQINAERARHSAS